MLTIGQVLERASKNRDAAVVLAQAKAIDAGVWDGDPWKYQQKQSIFVWSQPELIVAQDVLYSVGVAGYDGVQQLEIIKTSTPGDILASQGLLPISTVVLSPIATIADDYSALTPEEFEAKYGITQSQYNLGSLPIMPAIPGVCPAVTI